MLEWYEPGVNVCWATGLAQMTFERLDAKQQHAARY